MSASQATILDFINLRLGDVGNMGIGVGVDVSGHAQRVFGMIRSNREANTDAAPTVQAIAVTTHKWAAKVGKYNDDPIWDEIFANIRESRRQIVEE